MTVKKIEKGCGCPGTRALIIAHHGDNGGELRDQYVQVHVDITEDESMSQ